LKKPALTSIKPSCNYNFLTLGSDDKGKVLFAFLDFFSCISLSWSLLPIVKRLYPWLCQCGLLKHFEVLIIYQSALHTDALRPGFILMAVFTFQVVVLKRNHDGSAQNYMNILLRHRSAVYCTVYLKGVSFSEVVNGVWVVSS